MVGELQKYHNAPDSSCGGEIGFNPSFFFFAVGGLLSTVCIGATIPVLMLYEHTDQLKIIPPVPSPEVAIVVGGILATAAIVVPVAVVSFLAARSVSRN